MMYNAKVFCSVLLILIFFCTGVLANSGDFPGRTHKKYKTVPYIELTDLYKKLDEVIIVDARSKFEFDTLRIKSAISVPIALESFDSEIAKLREGSSKPIVFYCNGHTCFKSYKATKRAMAAGIDDVYAFDAGIFDWTKAHPDQASLLGKSPVNLEHLISKNALKKRTLDPDTFSDRATIDHGKTLIIDIRDKFQRAGVGFYPGLERWVSLNEMDKLYKKIRKASKENRTIYIYDAVGKQVRWFQYALERLGVKKYYFMEKGAKGYYKMIATL